MTDERTRVRQAGRTAARVVDGQAIVIVIDRQKLYTLNEIGSTIWELSDGRSLGSIVDEVVARFEVDRPTALSDTLGFVDELTRVGALEAKEEHR